MGLYVSPAFLGRNAPAVSVIFLIIYFRKMVFAGPALTKKGLLKICNRAVAQSERR